MLINDKYSWGIPFQFPNGFSLNPATQGRLNWANPFNSLTDSHIHYWKRYGKVEKVKAFNSLTDSHGIL